MFSLHDPLCSWLCRSWACATSSGVVCADQCVGCRAKRLCWTLSRSQTRSTASSTATRSMTMLPPDTEYRLHSKQCKRNTGSAQLKPCLFFIKNKMFGAGKDAWHLLCEWPGYRMGMLNAAWHSTSRISLRHVSSRPGSATHCTDTGIPAIPAIVSCTTRSTGSFCPPPAGQLPIACSSSRVAAVTRMVPAGKSRMLKICV
jgi:hypothetical protein